MRGDITFLPPRTSTTDSVGIMICPILSVRPNAATRPSSDSFTFFSKPEYVCTMYHCLDMMSFISEFLEVSVHDHVQMAERQIRQPEIDPEKRHRHRDHDRGGHHVLPRRPVHLAHLHPHLVEKAAQPLRIGAELSGRLHQRKTADVPVVFALFQVSLFLVRHLRVRRCPLAVPASINLAGEEGFEPPLSVLETDGLPLNLLP